MPVYLLRAGILVGGLVWAARQLNGSMLVPEAVVPWLPFILWSALSVAWSDQIATSLNAIVSMALLLGGAWAITLPLSIKQVAQAILISSVFVVVLSAIFIVFLPGYGMHQIADVKQSVHAGAWRGIFLHKNHFGQLCAVYAAACLVAGRDVIPNTFLKWAWTAVLVGIVVQSRSSSAIAIVLLTPLALWVTVVLRPAYRFVASVFLIVATAVAAFGLEVLLSLIGRDVTLTGRTTIWEVAFQELADRAIQGYGYMSLSYGDFALSIYLRMGVRDPHNMYLDILLGGGVIGLVFFVIPIVVAWLGAEAKAAKPGDARDGALVLFATVIAWMLAGLSESDGRPLAGVLGLAVCALLKLAPSSLASSAGSQTRLAASHEKEVPDTVNGKRSSARVHLPPRGMRGDNQRRLRTPIYKDHNL